MVPPPQESLTGKRSRRPSKALLRSQGLPSESSSGSGSDHPTGNSAAPTPPPPSLPASARASVVAESPSRPSTPENPASAQPTVPTQTSGNLKDEARRRVKFEARFKCATTSNEDVLKKQMSSWKSPVYSHFKMPPDIIPDAHGNVVYSYRCIARPSIAITRVRHDESTSNLKRHVNTCTPSDSQEARAMTTYAQGSKYNEATHRMKIALWVARRNRPFSIVEDEELLDIFKDLNSNCITPLRKTVAQDIREIFTMSRQNIGEILRAYPGKLHICADGWTSPNVIAFIGTTVHWIVNGEMVSTILDFIKATKAHTGVYLAARIAECLRDYGIQDKVLGFTADNASNNDTLVTELSQILPSFKGKAGRVRCFAHILNLVVKSILSQFSRKGKATQFADDIDMIEEESFKSQIDELEAELDGGGVVGDEEPQVEDEDDNIAGDVAASDAAVVRDIVMEAQQNERLTALSRSEANLGCLSIAKLRTLANKIANSPTIKEDLVTACQSAGIPAKLMIRDVSTRWNSTAELVRRALDLKDALDILVVNAEHNKPRGVRLRRFRLSSNEWALLEELSPLLELFLYATKEISLTKTPLLHQVIPMIDIITSAMDEFIDNTSLQPAIRHAALRGMLMLNKYYGRTDESILYRIAMILHPRYKSSYFLKAHWPRDWIEEAEKIARAEWKASYQPTNPGTPIATNPETSSVRFSAAKKYFDVLKDKSQPVDALEEWLASPVVNTNAEPITYWTAQNKAGHPLAPMALDFLSIPASSTDVERAFSKGGLTVSRFRHSLSDESVRAASVVGSWAKLDGAIPHDKIINLLKDKRKRTRKKQKIASRKSDSDIEMIDN